MTEYVNRVPKDDRLVIGVKSRMTATQQGLSLSMEEDAVSLCL